MGAQLPEQLCVPLRTLIYGIYEIRNMNGIYEKKAGDGDVILSSIISDVGWVWMIISLQCILLKNNTDKTDKRKIF